MTKRTAILLGATLIIIIVAIALTTTAWIITIGWLKLVVLIALVQ